MVVLVKRKTWNVLLNSVLLDVVSATLFYTKLLLLRLKSQYWNQHSMRILFYFFLQLTGFVLFFLVWLSQAAVEPGAVSPKVVSVPKQTDEGAEQSRCR